MKIIILLFLALSLAGCVIALPVQENRPPETLGQWGFRPYLTGGTSPQIGFESPGDTPTSSAAQTWIQEGVGLDVGLLDNLDLEIYEGVSFPGGDSKLGLRYQWHGESYFKAQPQSWSATASLHYVTSTSGNFNSAGDTLVTSFFENVNGYGFEGAQSFGYRLTPGFGFYGGPKLTSINLSGQYSTNPSGAFVNVTRGVFGYGAFGGLYFNPHSDHIGLEIILEYQAMNFPASFTGGTAWYQTYCLSFAVPFNFKTEAKPLIP